MSNKKGLSFEARLWLFVFILIAFLCVICAAATLSDIIGFIVYSPHSIGVVVVIAACMIASAIIIAAGILAYTIHKVFGKNNDEKK